MVLRLRRHRLRVVGRGVRLSHIGIVHLRRRVLLMVLIVGSPPTHIWRHALPCRQMTTIHHAGLGQWESRCPNRVLVSVPARCSRIAVVESGDCSAHRWLKLRECSARRWSNIRGNRGWRASIRGCRMSSGRCCRYQNYGGREKDD